MLFIIVQENSKDPGDIAKHVLNPRAPSKKTKAKQALLGTAQLNDKNKGELTTLNATQSQQMAALQRQSAGLCYNTHTHTQPFYGSRDSVRDNPGEPVPEETFTHLHLS